MSTILTKATLIVTLALGAIGAFGAVSSANADDVDVEFRFGNRHHRPVYDEPGFHRPRYDRPRVVIEQPPVIVVRPSYGRCSEELALQKAYYNGVNRPYISKVNDRKVVVQGKMRGMWVKMAFANVRGCPPF